jgi:hypothetical protein
MRLKPIAKNQTEITKMDGTLIFFSYDTPVACCIENQFYRTDKKWSVTTTRHINAWLDGRPAETVSQQWIDSMVG